MKKNVVAGLGEIGKPLYQLISKSNLCIGYDINPKLVNQKQVSKYDKIPTLILHISIPFNKQFNFHVTSLYKKFKPEIIVIHSTISPYTTKKLQNKI